MNGQASDTRIQTEAKEGVIFAVAIVDTPSEAHAEAQTEANREIPGQLVVQGIDRIAAETLLIVNTNIAGQLMDTIEERLRQ